MVTLQTVQVHNTGLKSLVPGLVAVFVGGTSGISLSTALSLARHTQSPKIYLIGRNETAAQTAITQLKTINPTSQPTFLKTDISLLKNVDTVCADIASRETRLNLLFMTPGYITLKGRDETSEGLDRKFVLHYYARMRFIANLLPLLTSAATATATTNPQQRQLSRVISVLDPLVSTRLFGPGTLNFSDLSLKHNFTLKTCGAHASLMNNFYLEGMAQRYPDTSFIHAYPSGVDTGVLRDVPGAKVLSAIARPLLSKFMVPVGESGERHLFLGTSGRYRSKFRNSGEGEADGVESKGEEEDVVIGSDGTKGSGCYWVSWDGEVFPYNRKMDGTRGLGAVEKVVKHTEEVFRKVCVEGEKYP